MRIDFLCGPPRVLNRNIGWIIFAPRFQRSNRYFVFTPSGRNRKRFGTVQLPETDARLRSEFEIDSSSPTFPSRRARTGQPYTRVYSRLLPLFLSVQKPRGKRFRVLCTAVIFLRLDRKPRSWRRCHEKLDGDDGETSRTESSSHLPVHTTFFFFLRLITLHEFFPPRDKQVFHFISLLFHVFARRRSCTVPVPPATYIGRDDKRVGAGGGGGRRRIFTSTKSENNITTRIIENPG